MSKIKFGTIRRRNQTISFLIFSVLAILLFTTLFIANPWYKIPVEWYFIPVLGLVGSFLTPVFTGRHYCGQYCPTSYIADGINPVNKSGFILKSKIFRYPFLLLFISIFAISFSTWDMGLPNTMTSTYWQAVVNKLWILWLICPFTIALPLIVIIGKIKGGRTWCTYMCPWGTIGSFLAKPKLEVTEECNNCGNCLKVCPQPEVRENVLGIGGLVHKDCLVCLKCVDVCPKDANKLN